MGFNVTPAAVAAYGTVISNQADHCGEAISYLDKHVAVSESGTGLIQPAEQCNPQILDDVRDAMERAETFFVDSGSALSDAAEWYETTDEDKAAELDKLYTEGESITIEKPVSVQTLPSEQVDPTEQLVAPPDEPDKFDNGPFVAVESLNSWLSLQYWVRELIKEAAGFDPMEDAVAKLTGDWKAFAKAAKGCEHLADFYGETYTNIAQYGPLAYHWEGNAAKMAIAYFAISGTYFVNDDSVPVPTDCTEAGIVYSETSYWGYYWSFKLLANEYLTLAQRVSEFSGAIVSILGEIADMAIWGIISATVGAVTSWTGVGAALGEGFAGLCVVRIGSKIADYSSNIGEIKSAVDTFSGLDVMAGSPLYGLKALKLPKPYSHPGV